MVINPAALNFDEDVGRVILITASNVTDTGFISGRNYLFSAIGGMALCRWGTDAASSADGGFDFAVPAGASIVVRATNSALSVIEADNTSSATAALFAGRLMEDI